MLDLSGAKAAQAIVILAGGSDTTRESRVATLCETFSQESGAFFEPPILRTASRAAVSVSFTLASKLPFSNRRKGRPILLLTGG